MNKIDFLSKNYSQSFLDKVFLNLEKNNIDISKLYLDHICFRVSSEENYVYYKDYLSKYGKLISENIVNGRPISCFKLKDGIIYKKRIINIIELPFPKKGSDYLDGFEHVEFVIKESFDKFMKKYTKIIFETKDILKELNPDIKIQFNDFCVKFHNQTLEEVINIENNI